MWRSNRGFAARVVSLVAFSALVAPLALIHVLNHEAQAQGTGPSRIPPFDLVWDSVDGNSLPLGPFWHSQKLSPVLPSFKAFCGPAFSGFDIRNPFPADRGVNDALLSNLCSSQRPLTDFPPGPIPCDTPTADRVLPGHLNWAITTHSGFVFWSEYDDFDGDINVELIQPDHNAETALNTGTHYGIHSEFKRYETMGNFMHPWWVDFRKLAFDKTKDPQLHELIDGKRAVITGLLGIDGVHGGYTELHPVFSFAIESRRQGMQDGINETWDFFLRNRGGEGCCSSQAHQWDGLADLHGGWHWYFIQFPSPPELQGHVTASVLPGTLQVFANGGFIGPVISQDAQWVYLGFRLPDPSQSPELDGEITLHYTPQNPQPLPTMQRPAVAVAAKVRMTPRGDDWDAVRKHMQPAELKKLDDAVQSSQLVAVKPQPHTVRMAIPSSPTIIPHQPLIGPGHRGQLTRTKPVVDPADAAARAQLNEKLQPIIPREVVQLKPQP